MWGAARVALEVAAAGALPWQEPRLRIKALFGTLEARSPAGSGRPPRPAPARHVRVAARLLVPVAAIWHDWSSDARSLIDDDQ